MWRPDDLTMSELATGGLGRAESGGMNDQSKPLHRERLLDLKSKNTVPHPSRLELPHEEAAAPVPEIDASESMPHDSDDAARS
jgi:hypothetical protein